MENRNILLPNSSTSAMNIPASETASPKTEDLSGPKFKKDIETAKVNGWGNQIKNLVSEKKYTILSTALLVVAIIAGLWMANSVSLNSLQANLATTETNVTPLITIDDATLNSTTSGTLLVQTAELGEGVTHLARKAVTAYITENDLALSAEQRVYMEDYLKDMQGALTLGVGDTVTFEAETLDNALVQAQALENWQIENLTQYTQNVQF